MCTLIKSHLSGNSLATDPKDRTLARSQKIDRTRLLGVAGIVHLFGTYICMCIKIVLDFV